ncbi:hypothetical protein WJX74_001873 [Apatococcus lobatus]|uniref:Uncharacterized protein n=1 Tax=Apatococcus lobatus TaxID=904363 RepID=A0AAW1Q1Q9_9CHLO
MEWTDRIRHASDIQTYLVGNLRPPTQAEVAASGLANLDRYVNPELVLCYSGADVMHHVFRVDASVRDEGDSTYAPGDAFLFFIGPASASSPEYAMSFGLDALIRKVAVQYKKDFVDD